jgi:hypothetical protein
MSKCEVCGNEYDKSFELIAAGARHTFDSFEMRDSSDCAHLRALQVPGYRTRRGGRWPFLLLRPLRTARNQGRCERPSRLAFGDLLQEG